MRGYVILGMIAMLLVPIYASAQSPDRIAIIDNFGDYKHGDPLFIYGTVSNLSAGSFLILQIVNPHGDMCQIQQLSPLPSGSFLTDAIPLKGRICGVAGEYEVRLFYGQYTKTAAFTVSAGSSAIPSAEQRLELAHELVKQQADLVYESTGITHQVPGSDATLDELEEAYVILWSGYSDEYLYEVDPLIRGAAISSLDSVEKLLLENEIPLEISQTVNGFVFRAIFHYETGDKELAIDLLTDAFVDVRNIIPEEKFVREPTFDELEDTLLSLMTKTGTILGKDVKSEVAFIFSRGTAPVFSQEITSLVDILTESRYLDVISRKDSPLYNIVQRNWEVLKPSLLEKRSIDDLLESSEKVRGLYDAASLLRELDGVERFISSDPDKNGALAELIQPDWESLQASLELASTIDDILESKQEILEMKQIIEISSRISKSVDISESNDVSSDLISGWSDLLKRVDDARSTDEILSIVSEFDRSITELRDKRSPLVTLDFQYTELKQKAELQADYTSLVTIDQALRIIETARQIESGNPSVSRIDRMEVLLTWASEQEPVIRADLDSYTKDVSKERASRILERTQSLDNLVDLGLTKYRFLPNYVEFSDGLSERIGQVRDYVISNDLEAADSLLTSLYDEWVAVSEAYAEDPRGSDVGYSLTELKRIDFREKLDAFESTVETFRNPGFEEHAAEYQELIGDLEDMISRANFVDAEKKVNEIATFLSSSLVLSDPGIIFDISFDLSTNNWVIRGATEKAAFEQRDELIVVIYDVDGSIYNELEFTNTKHGDFFTQWTAPTEPGLYVALLKHKYPPKTATATQIVNVAHVFDTIHSVSDQSTASLAREFDELKSFAVRFGGADYGDSRLANSIYDIEELFSSSSTGSVDSKLDQLMGLMERYLPVRSREAIVEAEYATDRLVLSGAVVKDIAFSENLYVDVFDQRGDRVSEISLKDNSAGQFAQTVPVSFSPGIYAVELEYLDITVSDMFIVG